MTIYIVATLISMTFAALASASERSALAIQKNSKNDYSHKLDNGRTLFIICSAIPLISIAALRHEIGTDWPIYYDFFYSINEGTEQFDEVGFNLLNQIVYLISDDFALMVAVVSVITYSFIFKAIYDQSVNYSFSILFFVLDATYFNSMNQLRQMMTVAIFLYALKYLRKRKFIPYLMWILLACTLHTSALLFIPIYFLYGFPVSLFLHIITIGAGAVLMIPVNKLFNFVISKTRYSWYLDSVYVSTTGFYIVGFVFSFIILVLYNFYYYYGEDKNDKDYNFFVNMQWISILVLFLTESVPQVNRILLCFAAPICFGIPKMILREKIQNRRLVLIAIVVAIFAVKILYDVYSNDWYTVIPYETIFTRQSD